MHVNRRPLAVANWKMAMTVTESNRFIQDFFRLSAAIIEQVDVVICPPFTALQPVAELLRRIGQPSVMLGAQNVSAAADIARTGDISAELIKDAGCHWVMVGHWEIRRRYGENDDQVRQKVQQAFSHNLRPILLVGEAQDSNVAPDKAITGHLEIVLSGSRAKEVARMAFVYEPEDAIGVEGPAPVEHIAAGCHTIRQWLAGNFGPGVAGSVRIIYGGSVTPSSAAHLLSIQDLDGLGASRRGRNPQSFFEIVSMIAEAKAG